MASPQARVSGLSKKLEHLDEAQLRATLLALYHDSDDYVRYIVNQTIEQKMNPRRSNNNTPNRKKRASPVGFKAGGQPSRTPSPAFSLRSQASGRSTPDFSQRIYKVPKGIRVQVYKNGWDTGGVTLAAKHMEGLLDDATAKLKLTNTAVRLYDKDGNVINTLAPLYTDCCVYASQGEAFRPPGENARTRRTPGADVNVSARLSGAVGKRIHIFRNGDASGDHARVVVKPVTSSMPAELVWERLLDGCTTALALTSAAKRLFTADGRELKHPDEVEAHGWVAVSTGGAWRDPDDQKPRVTINRLPEGHRLIAAPAKAVQVIKNGVVPLPSRPAANAVGRSLDEIMEAATVILSLPSAVRRLYDEDGHVITEFDELQRNALYYASMGESFLPPDEPTAIASQRIQRLSENSRLATKPKTRVLARRNGDIEGGIRVVLSKMETVLDECTRRLKLPSVARRLYDEEGTLITDFSLCENDQLIYVSVGEGFLKPQKIRAVETTITPIPEDSGLLSAGKIRVKVIRNGWAQAARERMIVGFDLDDLLEEATIALELPYAAKKLFTDRGQQIMSADQIERDSLLVVSCGEAYKPPTGGKVSKKFSPRKQSARSARSTPADDSGSVSG